MMAIIASLAKPSFGAAANNVTLSTDETSLVETSRAPFANYLHLMASDLLDELIYNWSENPPVGKPTPVVLLGVNAPLGLNAHLEAFLENHYFSLVTSHPNTMIVPVYCAQCTALTTVSKHEKTVMGRGFDVIENLDLEIQNPNTLGLYLDFSAEGSTLVLRSRLVSLKKERAVVAAMTVATSSSTPPLLRKVNPLVSADQARSDYLAILNNRSPIEIPMRFSLEFFQNSSSSSGDSNVSLPPMLWLQIGIETYISKRKEWLGGMFLGSSSLPGSHDAISLGTRISRLYNDHYSMVSPNYYLFWDMSYFELNGSTASMFKSKDRITPAEIIEESKGEKKRPKVAEGKIKYGAELRFRQFYRAEIFLELLPNQIKNDNLQLMGGIAHAWGLGMGVTL